MIKDNSKRSYNIDKAYHNKKYIVAYKSVYQPFYSTNVGYYAQKVYTSPHKLTLAGRFIHRTGDEVNRLIDIVLFNNL